VSRRSPFTQPPSSQQTDDHFAGYRAAIDTLNALMQTPGASRDSSPVAIRARAQKRLDRVSTFLAFLGNPQSSYAVVHVGGTSGKGSTSVAIAGMLTAGGYRTGLHTSPYLQAATEKLQVNGVLISGSAFRALVDEAIERAARWLTKTRQSEPLTYGEIWIALTFLYFARERVDLAVIEVGAGGRFDLTNIVRPAVSVITSIGLDHTVTLGPTVPEIAWHKAGIIKDAVPVVTAVTNPAALQPILDESVLRRAPVIRVIPDETFQVIHLGPTNSSWRERNTDGVLGPTLSTALPGEIQVTNAATAVAAVRSLHDRGFAVSIDALRTGMAASRLPGRVEQMPVTPPPAVLIDGAHNPQKMCAVAIDLSRLLQTETSSGRPVAVVGSIQGKDISAMLECLIPHVSAIVGTRAEVEGKESAAPEEIVVAAREAGFSGRLGTARKPQDAVDLARQWANDSHVPIVVIGSLFLAGEVRNRWYPLQAIVTERTSWPQSRPFNDESATTLSLGKPGPTR